MASHILLVAAVYWLAWSIFRSFLAGFLGALIIGLMNYALLDSGNGLETSLFMALVAASLASFFTFRSLRGRLLTGVLIALSVLARPEGVLLLPAVLIYLWIIRDPEAPLVRTAEEALALAGPGVAVLAGLSILSWSVNGTFLPGTGTAKMKFFQDNRLSWPKKLQETGDAMGLFYGPLAAIILLAALEIRRREVIAFGIFFLTMMAFYVAFFPGGLFHYFYRYQHPALPLLAAIAGGGGAYLVRQAISNGIVVKLLVVGAIFLAIVPVWEHFRVWHPIYRDASYETLVDMEGMVRDLNTIIRPDQTLATHDIGVVGYLGHFHVLDLVGLTNPDAVGYHDHRTLIDYINKVKPDYLLIFTKWDQQFLHLNADQHPEQFEFVKEYPGRNIRVEAYELYRIHYPSTLPQQ